jgi:hypothetical protein
LQSQRNGHRKKFLFIPILFSFTIIIAQTYKAEAPLAHTFSIIARDPVTGEMGVAVQSHWFSVGTQYWTAITLANNKQVGKALVILKKVFIKDANWKELTRRLTKVKLLTVSETDLNKILNL